MAGLSGASIKVALLGSGQFAGDVVAPTRLCGMGFLRAGAGAPGNMLGFAIFHPVDLWEQFILAFRSISLSDPGMKVKPILMRLDAK